MSRKRPAKYWEMTTEELREATKEFDQEFVADRATPMDAAMRARWERAKSKRPATRNGAAKQTIAVRLDSALVDQCTQLAKRKRISRDALIARSLKALLAAETSG